MFKNWAFVGVLLSILLIPLYILNYKMFLNDIYWPLRLLFPVLAFHQFEEYILPGSFIKWINRIILKSKYIDAPINTRNSFVPNVIIAWPITIYFSIYPYENIWITLGLILSIILSNALAHIFLSLKNRKYSPGLITSIILFLPMAAAALYLCIKHNLLYTSDWLLAIAIAVIIDVVIIMLSLFYKKKAIR
ncbi:MAG: HXXEE domain-containing protein [Ignavibacteria bacterium]|nr:HXXEE domain-containing protein [Ignavibacteria bacterium]